MNSQYGMSFFRKERYLREQERQSKFAPRIRCKGPHIKSSEPLARIVFHPDHTNPDGTVRVEGISRDDLTHRGFSVWRIKHTSRPDINRITSGYLKRVPGRRLEYVLAFLAADIRNRVDSQNYQAFIIVDDAPSPEKKGHALILCAENQSRSKVKELRQILVSHINKPQPLSDVFPQ